MPPLPPSGVLDPLLIDPLGRTRLKKLKSRPWTPGEKKSEVQNVLSVLRLNYAQALYKREAITSMKNIKYMFKICPVFNQGHSHKK